MRFQPNPSIRYTTTRCDLLYAGYRSLFHNRMVLGLWAAIITYVCYNSLQQQEIIYRSIWHKVVACMLTAGFVFVFLGGLSFILISLTVLKRKNKGVLGEHRITITDEGLVESTEHNESLNRWSAYHKTVSTSRYLLLYVNEAQLHTVSKRRPLIEGDLAAFEKALNEKTKANLH